MSQEYPLLYPLQGPEDPVKNILHGHHDKDDLLYYPSQSQKYSCKHKYYIQEYIYKGAALSSEISS